MKYVYILQVVEETDDEVRMEIHSVYTTQQKAVAIGNNLVNSNNGFLSYYVTPYMFFQ
jgi:hypothetical protein